MARFNAPAAADLPDTRNLAGGAAYAQEDELRLVSLLLTSFLGDQYYRSTQDTLAELVKTIHLVDPLFAAKAAVYARREFHMRSVTHVVAGELARVVKGEQWPRRFYEAVVERPDDVTEILAYYDTNFGFRGLPNSLKKGLARALEGFDDYQLAKYQARRRRVSLVDAVNLCHPAATPAITRLVTGTLPPADTWEVAMTRIGQATGDQSKRIRLRRSAWRRLLAEGKLGYFALLRNLANMLWLADAELLELIVAQLTDRQRIKASGVLPFRFITAIKNVKWFAAPGIVDALDEAMEIAFDNVPALPGTTLVAVDASGSMLWDEYKWPIEKALMFATAIARKSRSDIMLFDDDAAFVPFDPHDRFRVIVGRMAAMVTGGGTKFPLVFDTARRRYDRIIILSDMQAWVGDSTWRSDPGPARQRYRERTGADPAVFCVDLAGYGTLQFPADKVYQLTGFSAAICDLMAKVEGDHDALLHAVEAVEF